MNRTRTGVALALATALISGVAIYLNSLAVRQIADAALFTTLKNGIAGAALLGVALAAARRDRPSLAGIGRSGLAGMILVGVFGGGIAFLLFFSGLAMASAPSAAFIHKTLFIWVALLAVPFAGERLGLVQIGALGALLASQLLISPPTGVVWGTGETLIAAATLIWAAEVVLAKRLLARIDPLVLGVGRLSIGLVVLVGYLAVSGKVALLSGLSLEQWSWVVLTGALLAGYVGTWFAALQRAPATLVTSVLVLGAPITALLATVTGGTVPAALPLAGYGLVVLAVAALALGGARRSSRATTSVSPAA